MKPRKKISLIGMLLLLFMHTSCAENDKVILLNALDKNDLDSVEKIFSTIDEDSLNKLTTETPSSVGDFSYKLNKDESGIVITAYNGNGGLVIIPSEIEGYPVKRIDTLAFKENNDIISVIIPFSVESMGIGCFYECDNLTSVFIPSSVTTIGERAFFDCDSLSVLKIMSVVKTIGEQSFAQCNSLTKVILPEPLEKISKAAFGGCQNLLEIHLADTIEVIDTGAFVRYKNLQTANIPQNIKDIGVGCFKDCVELCNLEIPEEIKKQRLLIIIHLLFKNVRNYQLQLESI